MIAFHYSKVFQKYANYFICGFRTLFEVCQTHTESSAAIPVSLSSYFLENISVCLMLRGKGVCTCETRHWRCSCCSRRRLHWESDGPDHEAYGEDSHFATFSSQNSTCFYIRPKSRPHNGSETIHQKWEANKMHLLLHVSKIWFSLLFWTGTWMNDFASNNSMKCARNHALYICEDWMRTTATRTRWKNEYH